MGLAIETVSGRATNPGATFTALTANTGDSFTVRSFPFESGAWIEGMWADSATGGDIRVRSPRLHDNVQGIRLRHDPAVARNLFGENVTQKLYPQDNLTFEITGGGAETDVGVLQIYYQDAPGMDARLAMWEQISPRIVNLVGVPVAISAATTLGDWSAGTPLDTTVDLLKVNVDYAVLGYESDLDVAAIAIRGPDTGNVRVGGPASLETLETRDWFIRQARMHGTPHIPVINAANKSSTLVYQVDSAAGATNNATLLLAELSAG